MKSILRGLYNGDIIPCERRELHREAYAETVRSIESEERYFLENLPPEDRGRFQAFERLYDGLVCAGEESAFSCGFALGLLAALDVADEAAALSLRRA